MQIAILSFFHYFTPMFKKRENIFEVEEGKFLSPKFDSDGLIPVVTTDCKSGDVLMHGYMNEDALKKQLKLKRLITGADLESLCGTKENLVVLSKKLLSLE